jgi:hypothetical protein
MDLGDLPESKIFDPPGRCIYCDNDKVPLEREHIIPLSLGGQLIFLEASCRTCAKIIGKFEAPCLNRGFVQVRTHLNLPMYDPSYRPTELRTYALPPRAPRMKVNRKKLTMLPVAEHPLTILMPTYDVPGALRGQPNIWSPKATGIQSWVEDGAKDKLAAVAPHAGVLFDFHDGFFCAFLAKIAHGAACVRFGLDGFEPYLKDVVLGKKPGLAALVGASALPGEKTEALHRINFRFHQNHFIAAVQLFSRYGLKPYDVIVGRILPS